MSGEGQLSKGGWEQSQLALWGQWNPNPALLTLALNAEQEDTGLRNTAMQGLTKR